MEIRKKIVKIVKEISGAKKVSLDSLLKKDLAIDSLGMVNINSLNRRGTRHRARRSRIWTRLFLIKYPI